jgi:hypothetical protein
MAKFALLSSYIELRWQGAPKRPLAPVMKDSSQHASIQTYGIRAQEKCLQQRTLTNIEGKATSCLVPKCAGVRNEILSTVVNIICLSFLGLVKLSKYASSLNQSTCKYR